VCSELRVDQRVKRGPAGRCKDCRGFLADAVQHVGLADDEAAELLRGAHARSERAPAFLLPHDLQLLLLPFDDCWFWPATTRKQEFAILKRRRELMAEAWRRRLRMPDVSSVTDVWLAETWADDSQEIRPEAYKPQTK
jgi:hypothetical protein